MQMGLCKRANCSVCVCVCVSSSYDAELGALWCRGLAVTMGIEDFSSADQWRPFAKEALQLRQ